MIVMIGATIHHTARGDASSAITTFVLLGMATVVAYMRWRIVPIEPRRDRHAHADTSGAAAR